MNKSLVSCFFDSRCIVCKLLFTYCVCYLVVCQCFRGLLLVCQYHKLYWTEHVTELITGTRRSGCQHVSLPASPKWEYVSLLFTMIIFIGDPICDRPYIVTIQKVVFANKSGKLGWIWMKLGRWCWGLKLKRLSRARFQWNRAIDSGPD